MELPLRRSRGSDALLCASRTSADAFVHFYEAYAERVIRFLARRLLDTELAYELHAEVFAIAFEQRTTFRGRTPEEEQGWLFAIARSQLSAYWRRGDVERAALSRLQLTRPALDDAALERLEDLAELDTLRPRLAEAIDRLPDDQREAVRMRVVDEAGYAEIAAHQGVSNALARARVSRGLRTLARALQQGDVEELV